LAKAATVRTGHAQRDQRLPAHGRGKPGRLHVGGQGAGPGQGAPALAEHDALAGGDRPLTHAESGPAQRAGQDRRVIAHGCSRGAAQLSGQDHVSGLKVWIQGSAETRDQNRAARLGPGQL
jgi:hypothetical protein